MIPPHTHAAFWMKLPKALPPPQKREEVTTKITILPKKNGYPRPRGEGRVTVELSIESFVRTSI